MVGDINEVIYDAPITAGAHPCRTCLYAEAQACIELRKDSESVIREQIDQYRAEGFPERYGLTQNCILMRHHNNSDCINLMEMWWNEVRDKSHRDQLSFSYAQWKYNNYKINVVSTTLFNSKWFKWKMDHK